MHLFDVASYNYVEEGLDGLLGSAYGLVSRPDRILMSAVGCRAMREQVIANARTRWQLDVENVVVRASGFGVRNGYQEPHSLGVDRWLAMIAAFAEIGGPCCIADCGTAVTIDLVTAVPTSTTHTALREWYQAPTTAAQRSVPCCSTSW